MDLIKITNIYIYTLSASSLPTDVWIPSSSNNKTSNWQTILNWLLPKIFKENQYELSLEGYYKTMKNLIEYNENYIPGTVLELDNIDNNLVSGNGTSYGFELFFLKTG